MLKVKLVFGTGVHRGKHCALRRETFLIGRSTEADLTLDTNRVSRRHCLIRCAEHGVTLEDLGSRNGVRLNDKVVEPNTSHAVYHHDLIDIGEWRFRFSIRDRDSNAPVTADKPANMTVPTTAGQDAQGSGNNEVLREAASQTVDIGGVMNELDQLAEELQDLEPVPGSPAIKMQQTGAMDTKEMAGPTSETWREEASAESGSQHSPEESNSPPQSASDSKDPVSGKDTPDQGTASESIVDEENTEGRPSGPGKLPEHLRPKGPIDSTDAAGLALKRLFG